LEAGSFVAVIVGVPLGLYQLWSDAGVRQIDKTMTFASRFNDEYLNTVRNDLIEPWVEYMPQLKAINDAGGMSRSEINELVKVVVERNYRTSKDNLQLSIFTMADFFDQLGICIESGLCDRSVARLYFSQFAIQFDCLYGVIIDEIRSAFSIPDLGKGVKILRERAACP
jgi:hypothetical protein